MSFPLNPAQREAVRHVEGPLLVLAGAGSGKTRVIAAKVAYLIERGFDPQRIVAITFTNRAAREMRERVGQALGARGRGDAAGAVTVCTFHALGVKIIRGDAAALGLPSGFSILDPDDIEPIVAELVGTSDRSRARAAQWKISAWKNALVPPRSALKEAQSDDEAAAAQAYLRYDESLRAYRAVDFDDLIALPIALLGRNEAAAAKWRERCAHLLVDEYQDTNPAQYRLMKLLVGEGAAFTAVGDDDQAIYGWRGASLDNLAQLPRDFASLKVVKLEQNYRSTVRILRSANALIANDDDDPAFIRAVTTPKRGIGAATLEKLGAIGAARRQSLFAAVYDADAAALPSRQREVLGAFCSLVNGLRHRAEREPAGRLLDELVVAIDYEDFLLATCDRKEAQARWQSVRDFIDWLAAKGEADRKNLLELTQTIALITMLEGREANEPDAVRLSTLHAAKGLEFAHVFIVGLEEGLLPHREAVASGNIDEERRLLYVGVTRAQRSLHLSFCRQRRRAGEPVECQPSRFLSEFAADDLRWAGAPVPADEAAREKEAGRERLKNLKAMLAAK